MIITFNQTARFKPATTARRLKTYYQSSDFRPEVFLSYLCLINIVATLCPTVRRLDHELYRKEVRQLFFCYGYRREVVRFLWRFRRFFTGKELCGLLAAGGESAVLEPTAMRRFWQRCCTFCSTGLRGCFEAIVCGTIGISVKVIPNKIQQFRIEYSENLEKNVDIAA